MVVFLFINGTFETFLFSSRPFLNSNDFWGLPPAYPSRVGWFPYNLSDFLVIYQIFSYPIPKFEIISCLSILIDLLPKLDIQVGDTVFLKNRRGLNSFSLPSKYPASATTVIHAQNQVIRTPKHVIVFSDCPHFLQQVVFQHYGLEIESKNFLTAINSLADLS